MAYRNQAALRKTDAKNRSLRTFLSGMAIDSAVAIAMLILASVDEITDRTGLVIFGVALAKTVATAIASYVLRQFLDPSDFPTPLPPADPGEPGVEVV